jgi:hypothetical protein
MFGSDGPAEHHPGGSRGPGQAGGASEGDRRQQPTPVPFSGGRKPTPRSMHIVSMQDSNAATSATGGLGAGGCRGEQQGTDRTKTTRVSGTAGVTPSHPRTFSSFFCSLIWFLGGVAAKAAAIGGHSPTTNFLLPRHRMPACMQLLRHRQSSDLLACTSNSCATRPSKRAYIFTHGLSSFFHMCLSKVQTFLDFNAVYILIK